MNYKLCAKEYIYTDRSALYCNNMSLFLCYTNIELYCNAFKWLVPCYELRQHKFLDFTVKKKTHMIIIGGLRVQLASIGLYTSKLLCTEVVK